MIRLADTSIRLYRKKNGTVSVRLHTYMMIHAKKYGFRLSTYLNQFNCMLTLSSGQKICMDEYFYTDACLYEMDHMVHELWISGITELEKMVDTVGRLYIEYRLFSFEGQGPPDVIDCYVPVLARGESSKRYSSNPKNWSKNSG